MSVYGGDSAFSTLDTDPPTSKRFFNGYPWRFVITDTPSTVSVGGVTTTWANNLFTGRSITFGLDQPTVISAALWPDSRAVNAIFDLDDEPLVAQSNRIVYCFRREGIRIENDEQKGPWWIRAAGILMSPEDQGDPDIPLTHFTAYDPWMFLTGRPARMFTGEIADIGAIPPPDGWLTWQPGPALSRGDQIVTGVLEQTIVQDGFAFIDAGVTHAGTNFWQGEIEETDDIWFQIQRGQSVADVWSALCDAGNLDIVLTPIYDPENRPGYTHDLSVYNRAGTVKRNAVFAWDKMMKNATTADRMHDGTPGQFFNTIQAYAGPGGVPVPLAGPLTNGPSVDRFTPYWLMQFQVSGGAVDPSGSAVLAMAAQELVLAKQGKRTTTITPTPERSPIPLLEYNVGDRVPYYASKRLRVTAAGPQRVQAIPITITDDGIEQVQSLLLSPDYKGNEEEQG